MKKLLVLALLLSLVSCKATRHTVEVPVYIHDTTQTVSLLHDTTQTVSLLHDSTYVDRWHTIETRGDTVFVTRTETLYRYRTRTDTLYRYRTRTDTALLYREVPVLQKVEVYREKELTRWQRFRLGAFWWLTGAAALSLAVWWRRRNFAS